MLVRNNAPRPTKLSMLESGKALHATCGRSGPQTEPVLHRVALSSRSFGFFATGADVRDALSVLRCIR